MALELFSLSLQKKLRKNNETIFGLTRQSHERRCP